MTYDVINVKMFWLDILSNMFYLFNHEVKEYHVGQVGECKNFMWPTCILLCDIYLNIKLSIMV